MFLEELGSPGPESSPGYLPILEAWVQTSLPEGGKMPCPSLVKAWRQNCFRIINPFPFASLRSKIGQQFVKQTATGALLALMTPDYPASLGCRIQNTAFSGATTSTQQTDLRKNKGVSGPQIGVLFPTWTILSHMAKTSALFQ